MLRKPFGPDGRLVPAIGMGMGLGGHFKADPRHEVFVDLMHLAFTRGMTFVDSAENYGAGQSETLIGQAVAGQRSEIFIATKVSPENFRKADLIRAAEASLSRLGIDCIDLYQLHWPNPAVPLEETVQALMDLIRAGKICRVGVCNFSLRELERIRALLGNIPVSAAQAEYNLFDRSVERDLLPYCQQHSISLIAYSPLDQGQICGGPRRRAGLERVAISFGCSAGQVALAWLIRQKNVFVIPKAGRPEHVEQNALAADIELSEDDAAIIGRLTACDPVELPTDRICVVPDGEGRRHVYTTIEEARENRLGFMPGPMELARDLSEGNFLKPVRVRLTEDRSGRFTHDLVEGRIRYWAWILAFGPDRPIFALVRE